ncbi:MAG: CBS domain-containing protein [Gammaproteobacteria bacterium]
MKLADLLEDKGAKTVTTSPNVSVATAIRTMHQNRVGSIIVLAEQGGALGIFTERDVMGLCAHGKGGELETLVLKDCMTANPIIGDPDDAMDDVLNLMTRRRFRHLPVVRDGKLLGMVSMGDLVKAKLTETTVEAQILREYISS